MCKNTDQTVGIPVPLPSILPPIEKWYIVARKPSSGTCSIYSSWADYEAESKSSRTRSLRSLISAENEKSTIKSSEEKELAAFPIMAQALTYIKVIGSESRSSSPPRSSIHSNLPTKQRHIKPNKHISHPKKRKSEGGIKTKVVSGESDDCNIDIGEDERSISNAKVSPTPISSEIPLKKRKVEDGLHRSDIINVKRPLTMSKTSETIDIGSRTQSNPDTSNLDALAIVASAKTNKKRGKPHQSQPLRVLKTNSDDSSIQTEISSAAGARLPPPIILPRGTIHATRPRVPTLPSLSPLPETILGRLPGRLSPSLIADYNNARKSIEQQKQHQKIIQQHNDQRNDVQYHPVRSSLTSKILIPEVPTIFTSSLKIPEVPRGLVLEESRSERINRAISDHLKSGIDPRISTITPTVTKAQNHHLRRIPNQLPLESYPLGQLPRHLQGLHQHLQAIPPTSMFQTSPHLLSHQLQSSQSLLNHQARYSNSAYAQHLRQQQLQAIEVASCASGTSDGDHSGVTLQRRNGIGSRDSPLSRD